MKERPILFSAPMVRAILGGWKTQTRRVVKRKPSDVTDAYLHPTRCPYGQPGDRLWARETWHSSPHFDFLYRADYPDDAVLRKVVAHGGWKPSIFMRRAHSRITLEVTAVRVERVQEISPDDAYAEGSAGWAADNRQRAPNGTIDKYNSIVKAYAALWDSINAKRAPWAANPWVWVVKFRVKSGERAKEGA